MIEAIVCSQIINSNSYEMQWDEIKPKTSIYYSYPDSSSKELPWPIKYKNFVRGFDINQFGKFIYQEQRYVLESSIDKNNINNSVLNIFGDMKKEDEQSTYYSRRLYEALEDNPDLAFNYSSFISFRNFTLESIQTDRKFDIKDFSLQVSDDGKACLQKTYENSYIFIEFSENNMIFYNIMTKNKDILVKEGTFDGFFKNLEEIQIC